MQDARLFSNDWMPRPSEIAVQGLEQEIAYESAKFIFRVSATFWRTERFSFRSWV
jgi:hypothetical protein